MTEKALVYDVTLEAQGQKINFDYNVAVKKDGENWAVTESAKTPFGDIKQASLVSGKDYTVLNKTMEQGPMKMNYTVSGGNINGGMEAMGNTQPINANTSGKTLFAADEAAGQFLAVLPLTKGYTSTYSSLDAESMEVKDYILTVLDDESITVSRGTATCKKLEIYDKAEPSKKTYAWIDNTSKTIYKMIIDAGQTKFSFQLK